MIIKTETSEYKFKEERNIFILEKTKILDGKKSEIPVGKKFYGNKMKIKDGQLLLISDLPNQDPVTVAKTSSIVEIIGA
ncbi:MAG: hypothetical protein CMI54_06760 [Parcubacteria group bacterium]|nr:hypothetical protein [Parcubacteria group bacterium]|tara:strand:- start:47093 stop:47329 length:237 start_codon:yes stop_codon:yes gene_type:complete